MTTPRTDAERAREIADKRPPCGCTDRAACVTLRGFDVVIAAALADARREGAREGIEAAARAVGAVEVDTITPRDEPLQYALGTAVQCLRAVEAIAEPGDGREPRRALSSPADPSGTHTQGEGASHR